MRSRESSRHHDSLAAPMANLARPGSERTFADDLQRTMREVRSMPVLRSALVFDCGTGSTRAIYIEATSDTQMTSSAVDEFGALSDFLVGNKSDEFIARARTVVERLKVSASSAGAADADATGAVEREHTRCPDFVLFGMTAWVRSAPDAVRDAAFALVEPLRDALVALLRPAAATEEQEGQQSQTAIASGVVGCSTLAPSGSTRLRSWLWKKGRGVTGMLGGRRNWKQRYVSLDPDPSRCVLEWFQNERCVTARGRLPVAGAQVQRVEGSKYEHHLRIQFPVVGAAGPVHALDLRAKSSEECDAWVANLTHAAAQAGQAPGDARQRIALVELQHAEEALLEATAVRYAALQTGLCVPRVCLGTGGGSVQVTFHNPVADAAEGTADNVLAESTQSSAENEAGLDGSGSVHDVAHYIPIGFREGASMIEEGGADGATRWQARVEQELAAYTTSQSFVRQPGPLIGISGSFYGASDAGLPDGAMSAAQAIASYDTFITSKCDSVSTGGDDCEGSSAMHKQLANAMLQRALLSCIVTGDAEVRFCREWQIPFPFLTTWSSGWFLRALEIDD